jgi:hypothetical protein
MEVKKIIGLLQCERPARRRQDACNTELPGLIFDFHPQSLRECITRDGCADQDWSCTVKTLTCKAEKGNYSVSLE